jgi:DNA helicase-2/ATP-dependent DNA helicase PcrA
MFEHILVDEFQDTNSVQYELLRHLASVHENIFVVGDEDQSIYRWRGADYRNVLRFEEDYPRAEKILLEQNYRSTQMVLDAAMSVINQNQHRTPKRLRSMPDRGQGDRIQIHVSDDDVAEAEFVVRTIQELVKKGGAKASDFAIMYRTNAQSRLIEEAFLHANMPYRLVGAQRFYGRREVKDLIAYLRLVQNPADSVSLLRVINVPSRKFGDKAVADLQRVADRYETPMGIILMDLGREADRSQYWGEFPANLASRFAEFGALLAHWNKGFENQPLPELFDSILEGTAYHEYIEDGSEEGRSRWENVQELRGLTFEFEDRGLTTFLESLALISDQDTVAETADAPTLLTLHAAKGLEFPVVFIVGLDEGILPHSRALEDVANLEELFEERRLFYVGLTRAMYRIYLVRAERRRAYGQQRREFSQDRRISYADMLPSQFLKDIPKDYTFTATPRRSRVYRNTDWGDGYDDISPRPKSRVTTWSDMNTTRGSRSTGGDSSGHAPIIELKFQPMMRVRHSAWGEGTVLESRIMDGEETVDVEFKTVGFKRLIASLANLEIL